MEDSLNTLKDVGSVVSHSPVWLIILVVLNLTGVWLRWSSVCPNKFVPPFLVIGGILLNCLVGSVTEIQDGQRHPYIILGMLGFLIGAAAYGLHRTVVNWFWKRFGVVDEDTQKANTAFDERIKAEINQTKPEQKE